MRAPSLALLLLTMVAACGRPSKTEADIDCALDPVCAQKMRTANGAQPSKGDAPPTRKRQGRPNADEIFVTAKADDVVLNGNVLRGVPTLKAVTAILGQPSRVEKMANDIAVYDDFGIALYLDDGRVKAMSIFFDRYPSYKFMPKSLFTGKLLFGNKFVDSTMDATALASDVPNVAKRASIDSGDKTTVGYVQIAFKEE